MDQLELKEAVAQQEEHILRSTSCKGIIGTPHSYRTHGNPTTGEKYEACVRCGVPEQRRPNAASRSAH